MPATPPPDHPTSRLWAQFDSDTAQKLRLPAFCGVPDQLVDDIVLLSLASSRPAARLVARVPTMMRMLAHQTVIRNERCVGHIRGPIQWGETMTAWSSGIGVDDVFICGSPHRDFDVAENRLLVWLLRRMVGAGRRTTGEASKWFEGATLEQVRSQGMAAQRLLAHPSLRGVDGSRRLSSRELRLVRKSRHLAVYAAALKVSDRAAYPFERDEVRRLVSRTTVEDHRVMAMMLDAQRARGLAVPLLSVRGDYIVAGQLRYRCSEVYVDRRKSGTSGLYFGTMRLLTGLEPPEVVASADAYQLVRSAQDADSVITRALTARDAGYSASGLVQGSGSYSS